MMQRAFPAAGGDRTGDFGVAAEIPDGIEVDRGAQFGFAGFDTVQVVLEHAVFANRGDVVGIEMREVDFRVEQGMADTVFLDAVAQVVVVAVADVETGKHIVGQVGIAVAIAPLVE